MQIRPKQMCLLVTPAEIPEAEVHWASAPISENIVTSISLFWNLLSFHLLSILFHLYPIQAELEVNSIILKGVLGLAQLLCLTRASGNWNGHDL